MTKTTIVVLAAIVALSAPWTLRAQTVCRGPDSQTVLRRNTIARVVTDTALASARTMMAFPAVADSAIVVVTDESICTQARDAYNASLPTINQTSGRRVYVVRVGTVFSVDDPTLKFGEFGLAMTLSQTFAVLSKRTQ